MDRIPSQPDHAGPAPSPARRSGRGRAAGLGGDAARAGRELAAIAEDRRQRWCSARPCRCSSAGGRTCCCSTMTAMPRSSATAARRMGKPVREIWADAWDRIEPNADAGAGRRDACSSNREPRIAAARRRRGADLADLLLQSGPRRGRRGRRPVRHGHRGQPRRRRRGAAARERGAVPADRRFGAGADVGDQARPQAQLRQPRLCRLPRRHLRGGGRLRLAQHHPSRRRARASSPNRSPARRR